MKSYIICLSKIESSLSTAIDMQKVLDSYGMKNELFEGSYGGEIVEQYKRINRRYHPWNFKHGPSCQFSDEYRDSMRNPGEMGCFDSHYRLWEKCVELNEPIMIFEDDVKFTRAYIPVEFDEVLITVFGNPTKSAKYYHCHFLLGQND
jgi:GR25 family glycosyltransferase involved in LPS biosynthesis